MNRTISKELLDQCINLTRKYWANYGTDYDILQRRIDLAKEMTIGTDLGWLPVTDVLSSILASNGFKPTATNKEIYEVLNLLGWQVV